ncbi:hypothetical protein [Nocardia sp. AG03]|uniref:hypothetical protein n=1 Tax=Nocardia sp. AG03 TaxID=3025312 RepID=UPI00241858B6|nr:hypothetical protein [Nocardia sp. AG03]
MAVSVGRGSDLAVADRRLSAAEAYYSPPLAMYWVDVGVHHAVDKFDLPTAEGVFTFAAEADLSWRISDPVRAVADRTSSGEAVYRPFLAQEFRRLSRDFDPDQFAEAEKCINEHLGDRSFELTCGVTLLGCAVRLRPGASTHTHLREAGLDKRRAQRREAAHSALMHSAELHRVEDATLHDLTRQNRAHRRELTELEQQHQLILEQQRMSVYADALQTGELGVLALRLATNREDVNQVIQLMMDQKKLDFDSARLTLNALLEQRLVSRRDVQDIMSHATKLVAGQLNPRAMVGASVPPKSPELTALVKPAVEEAEIVDAPGSSGGDGG